jgi:magnesium chelatase family protein
MPEFGPAALQALRQPLEDGRITLVRVEGRMRFPARFALVGAANPCACGFRGDRTRACTCAPAVASRYLSRIGGPLMDRIDLVFDVERVDPGLLLGERTGASSAALLGSVLSARERSAARGLGPTATLQGTSLLRACRLSPTGARRLESAARLKHLSGRGVTRLLRVARTIADLDDSERVCEDHLAEALGLRAKEDG